MAKKKRSLKDFFANHYIYFIVGGLFIVLVIALIVFLVSRGDDEDEEYDEPATAITSNIDVPKDKLEEDKYPDVNGLLINYFDAMAVGDADTVASLSNVLTDEERIRIQVQAKYYNGFSDYKVFTKKGPAEDSYFAFVTYDISFVGSESLAPALSSVYVRTDDSGALYVDKNEPSDDEKAYFQALAVQDDVVDLCEEVEVNYNKALDKDDNLSNLMSSIKDQINEEVKNTLAARQQAASEAAAAEAAEAAAAEAAASAVTVRATDTVNIRASASKEGEALGKASIGQEFTRYEKMDNGWSKVDYNGREAYINSDYLEEVSSGSSGGSSEGGNAQEGAQMVTVKETVRIRSSANKDVDNNILGKAQRGLQLELLSREGEWVKVKYNGQEAYVSADYVE